MYIVMVCNIFVISIQIGPSDLSLSGTLFTEWHCFVILELEVLCRRRENTHKQRNKDLLSAENCCHHVCLALDLIVILKNQCYFTIIFNNREMHQCNQYTHTVSQLQKCQLSHQHLASNYKLPIKQSVKHRTALAPQLAHAEQTEISLYPFTSGFFKSLP